MIFTEILEESSNAIIARFCFVLFEKENIEGLSNGASEFVLGLNVLNYPLSWIEHCKFLVGKRRS